MGFFLIAALFAVSAGVAYSGIQSAKKAAKAAADSMAGVLVNKESNIEPIPVIYGERRVGGVRVFVSTKDVSGGDKNEYLYIALAMAEGEVESITDIYIDDTPITDSKFTGLYTINVHTGADNQAYDPLLTEANAGWSSDHKLSGIAYLAIKLKWDQDAFGGVPEITAVVKGRKVYDPRSGNTVYSNNPALCIRDYLTNNRFGKGLPASAIDDIAFSSAANDCDESVTFYSGGGTGKIFECNAVLQTDETLFDNIKTMLGGCRGFLPYNQGRYSLIIDKARSSVFAFDKETIIDGITIKGESKEDKFNRVIVKFANPDVDYQPDQAVWPDAGSTEESIFLAEDNGTLLVEDLTLDTITNYYAARDLARVLLKRSRNALRTQFKATSEALQLSVGDVVTVTHDTPAWNAKPFQVEEITLGYDGTCNVSLLEYDPSIYTYDTSAEQKSYPDTALPDPFSVAPVTNLSAVGSAQLNADGGTISAIDVSFTASADSFVDSYELTWVASGGDTQTIGINSIEYTIYNLDSLQTYNISVRAINALGAKSTSVSVINISPSVDVTAPAIPTSISVAGTFKQIDLAWTNPLDSDFAYIEIKRAGTAIENDAVYLAKTSGDHYIDSPYTSTATRYYWLRSVDRTGNASEWVSGGGGTAIQLVANDFDDGVIEIDFLTSTLQGTINDKVDTSTLNAEIATIEGLIDLKADQTDVNTIIDEVQDTGDTIDLVAERMLTLATTQSEQLGIVRDAGITVDPDNGSVTIQAVEALRSETETQLSQVNIDLDAAEAAITLKASITYVNNAIAAAELDPTDLESLNALELKVNQAEIDIDAAEAAILLKADTTIVNGIDIRVGQAEIDIDAAEAAILLKASNTDLNALGDRVSETEIEINALDIPSITQTVIDSRTLKAEIDRDNIRSLKDLLAAYKGRESLRTDLAFAQSSISADVNANRIATSTQRTELLGLIDQNEALILTEQTIRADETSALSTSIATVSATVDENAASIVIEAQARADADSAIVQTAETLAVLVDANAGSIVTEAIARADADTVITQTSQTLLARFGVSQEDTYENETTYSENDEVVYEGLVYKALKLTTGNLPTNSNYWQLVDTVSASISGAITEEREVRVNAEEAIAQSVTDLSVIVGNNTSDIETNAGDISNEEIARANADEVLTFTSRTLLSRFGIDTPDTYVPETTYVVDDEVVYSATLYKCILESTGNIPTNITYWQEIDPVSADIEAAVSAEALARTLADEAIAQSVTTLSASVTTNTANISTALSDAATAQSTADGKIDSFYQDTAPETASEGDFWIDTDDGKKLYRWDSTLPNPAWVEVQDDAIQTAINNAATAQSTADGKITTFYADEPPTAEGNGDLWIDTDDSNKLYRWNETIWQIVRDGGIQSAIDDAATAQSTADGKIVTFFQDEEPTATGIGDLWFDTNDKNKLYRWDATIWSDARDSDIAQAILDASDASIAASNAQDTADSKIVTFFQDEQPTAETTGDLWVDTDDKNKLYRWDGSDWVIIRDEGIVENAGLITNEQLARATADSALAQTASTIFAALDIPKSDTYNSERDYLVGEGAIYSGTPYICILDSTGNIPTDDTYWSEVETTSGAILENNEVRLGYCTLEGDVTNAKDKFTCELAGGTWSSDTSIVAAAKQIKLKQPDGTYAIVETAAEAYADDLGDIRTQYTVTIDNDGNVSGFGLVSDIIDGNPTSAFIVTADQFAIGGTDGTAGAYPFVFYAVDTDVTVGGETITIPAGTYIDSANVNYLNANQIEVGELSAQRLQLDDVTMDTDASGNLIIKTGGVGNVQIADLAVTTGKIDNLSVDTLQIADQAVTIPTGAYTAANMFTIYYYDSLTINYQTAQTVTFTQSASTPTEIFWSFFGDVRSGDSDAGDYGFSRIYVRVRRNGIIVLDYGKLFYLENDGQDKTGMVNGSFVHVGSAGSATYTLEIGRQGDYMQVSKRSLITTELKK